MTDEEKVRKKYPLAEASEVEPVLEQGQIAPVQWGYWWISDQPGLGGEEIGRGDTKDEAWADAASKLPAS